MLYSSFLEPAFLVVGSFSFFSAVFCLFLKRRFFFFPLPVPLFSLAAFYLGEGADASFCFIDRCPKISPKLAPLSEEPNSDKTCFSSSISRALMDKTTLRAALSMEETFASTFSPTAKRSGR